MNRPRALMTLGWFCNVALLLFAILIAVVGLRALVDGEWVAGARFVAAALFLYVFGRLMRRLLAGY